MELLDEVPGGLLTVGVLGVTLVLVVIGLVKKAVKLAVVGVVAFFGLGGWAYWEAASERADDAVEWAREQAERVEEETRDAGKEAKKKIDDLR